MRICFFCGNQNLSGGTERVSAMIANELVLNTNNEIFFLSLYEGCEPFFLLDTKIKVDSIFDEKVSFSKKYLIVVSRLRKYIKENRIDVVINVESILTLYSIPALWQLSVRNICWEHFNYKIDLGLKSRRIARRLAAFFCDDVVTLTERDREFWLEKKFTRANVVVISNPITITTDECINKKNNKRLLAVGRLTYQKGFDILLEAWNRVILERNDWKLEIVGDGEDKEKLYSTISKYKLSNSVIISPTTKNIKEKFNTSSLFVLSSRFEGFGLVLLEAQACGLPTVSFDCEVGPREIVLDGTGWLCGSIDSNQLAITLLKAFNDCDDNKKYEQLSLCALNNSQRFSLNKIIIRWIDFLTLD
ncbi:TPA: glycosyltransferase family 4 protein [Photobacterium damselae]